MEKELLQRIEELNLENITLKKSKEYKTGEDLAKFKSMLKKGRIDKILKKFLGRKKTAKLNAHGEFDNGFIEDKERTDRPKIAVYTCITGGYDSLVEPLLKFDNIDYYAFVDNKDMKPNKWKIEDIPESQSDGNNILKNRYLKFHPHEFFEKDYDYSIYIDGNIKVMSDLTSLCYSVNEKTGLSLHRHQFRDCIFNEIEVCKMLKKGNYDKLKAQVTGYEKQGFPRHFGMLECNVIVTDLKSDKSKKILLDWWEEFKKSESYRDQISLPFVLWKNEYSIDDVGFLGNNVYGNPKIRIHQHDFGK